VEAHERAALIGKLVLVDRCGLGCCGDLAGIVKEPAAFDPIGYFILDHFDGRDEVNWDSIKEVHGADNDST